MPHPAQLALILLLVPNTSLTDWTQQGGPALRSVMRAGALGLVNVRTAEKDAITTRGSCYSLGAGQRMRRTLDTKGLGYAVTPGNLGLSLSIDGVKGSSRGESATDVASAFYVEPTPTANLPAFAGGMTFTPDPNRHLTHSKSFEVDDCFDGVAGADVQIQAALRRHIRVLILSPNTSTSEYRQFDRLAPFVFYDPAAIHGHLLTSPSTRTLGLVTAGDITATILHYFNAPPIAPVNGNVITTVGYSGDPVQYLLAKDKTWMAQERLLALRPVIGVTIALLMVVALGVLRRSRTAGGALMAFIAGLPLVMGLSSSVPEAAATMVALGFAALIVRRWWTAEVFGIMTSAYLLGDALLSHGSLAAGSLLGYSPIEGARYYGVGNEVMGALLGSSVVTAAWLVKRGWGWGAVVLGVAATFALGDPQIGAKAGGFLAALLTMAGFAWSLSGKRFKPVVAALVVVGALVLGVVGLAFLSRFGHSHVSEALGAAHRGGVRVLAQIAMRKTAMDAHLVFHSVWVWVLLVAAYGMWAVRREWLTLTTDGVSAGRIQRNGLANRALFAGSVAATAASLALNDAGVVAAALCALYGFSVCAITAGSTGPESSVTAQPESFPDLPVFPTPEC